ncbi:hypothetical protein SPURM210S_06599 [Streptomyces purpurascens]
MSASTSARRAPAAAVGLVLVAILTLTACGDLHASGATAGAAPSRSAGPSPSAAGPSPSAAGASPSAAGASPSAAGASPYVEPGAVTGPRTTTRTTATAVPEMSPAHAKDAERGGRSHQAGARTAVEAADWDPATVREALLRLGYEEERVTRDGKRLGGTLTVTEMSSRWKDDGYVTPEGAQVALRVHDDACVMAFVQKTNFSAVANGLYPESGCFAPPFAH